MNNLLAKLKLQSPFWQGVGAIVSIVALLVSTSIAYDIYQKSLKFSELTIIRDYTYSLSSTTFGGESDKRILLSVDGETASNVKVYYYRLTNTGNTPITPSDYIEPLKISINKPFKILTTKKICSNRKSINSTWDKVDDRNFQLKPLLLNPNDSFATLVLVSDQLDTLPKGKVTDQTKESNNSNKDQQRIIPEPVWTARIVNIPDLRITSDEQKREAEAKSMGIFYTVFYHTGWSVYRFAGLTFILFVFGLFLGVQFGILQKTSPFYYIILSLLMGLSVITGDNISSRINSVEAQPLISNFSVILYFLLIAFFTFPAVKNFFRSKNVQTKN